MLVIHLHMPRMRVASNIVMAPRPVTNVNLLALRYTQSCICES